MRTSLGKAHPPGKPSALPETSGEYEVWAGPYWCWWEEHCIPSALEPLNMPRGRQNHRSSWGHKWREANCGSCPMNWAHEGSYAVGVGWELWFSDSETMNMVIHNPVTISPWSSGSWTLAKHELPCHMLNEPTRLCYFFKKNQHGLLHLGNIIKPDVECKDKQHKPPALGLYFST